jgi:phage terminase large subunit-like protein
VDPGAGSPAVVVVRRRRRRRFVFRRGSLVRIKGWGKDPFAAAIALVELLGPCRFGGWDGDGEPIAVPHPSPWVQIAAVSQDQTRNTMTLLPGLLGTPQRAKDLGVDLGKTIVYGPGSARLEAVTSNPRALEGSRPSMVIMGETHHWLPSNDGREMARAVARNLAKSRDGSARALSITNSHAPGENSVAEADHDAWVDIDAGKSRATGVLFDSLAAPADIDLADPQSLREGITLARGDSWWVDADRIAEEVLDPTTPVSMSRRFYLNQIVAPEDSWVSAQDWDRCQLGDRLMPGDVITIGFDGSRKDDATALVACRVADGFLVRLGVWAPPPNVAGDWEVDRDEVDAAVRSACETYDVAGMYCDLALWESYIDMWRDTVATAVRVKACGSHPLAFDMRSRRADFTRAADRFASDVEQKQLTHDGDRMLRQHVLNARRAPNRWGVSIRKESHMSQRKIDLAVAGVLAWQARNDVLASGAPTTTKRRPGRVRAFS